MFLCLAAMVQAQQVWTKVPPFPVSPFSNADSFLMKVQAYADELSRNIQAETRKMQDKVEKMSDQEKMQLAMKVSTQYQNMKPEDIIRFQQQTQEITDSNAIIQQLETDFDNRFNQLKSEMEAAMKKDLDPIMEEYHKLPDGEGTPDWAIAKGKQLSKEFDKKYSAICATYITGPDAKFKTWLTEYKTYLMQVNLPFMVKWYAYQSSQSGMGMSADNKMVEMEVVKKYLERCKTVFGYRRLDPMDQ